jgi:hypothetical protein
MRKLHHLLISGLLFFLTTFNAYSQLDSSYMTTEITFDSLNVVNQVSLNVFFNDLSDLGYIDVVVLVTDNPYPIHEMHLSLEDLLQNNQLLTDRVRVLLMTPESGVHYRVEVFPKNMDGAYVAQSVFEFDY